MVTNLPQKNAFVSLIVNIIRKSFKTRTNRYITEISRTIIAHNLVSVVKIAICVLFLTKEWRFRHF